MKGFSIIACLLCGCAGDVGQVGLVNVARQAEPPQRAPRPVITVLDNGTVIQYPKR